MGCVGIVWGVREEAGGLCLVVDAVPLAEGERYGDWVTHPRGHYEVWEAWRRLGPAGLAARGLPAAIAWHEYEHFPRGRVAFDTVRAGFTLYADQRLQRPGVLERVLRAFGLQAGRCAVRSDPHYQAVREL